MITSTLLYDPAVIESLAEGIVVHDASGQIVATNSSARRILQLDEGDLQAGTFEDPADHAIREDGSVLPKWEHPSMITLRTSQTLRNVIIGLRKEDGTTTWLSINSQPLVRAGETQPYAVVTSFSDITERRRSEQSLRDRQALLRTIFENSIDGVLLADPRTGMIREANAAACKMFGRTLDELVGVHRSELVAISDAELQAILEERAKTGRLRFEISHKRKSGEIFPAEVSSVLIHDTNGIPCASIFVRDISERRQIQRMKDEFISTVSHELRTPLTSIHGALRLLEGGLLGELPEAALEMLRIAAANTDRLRTLLDDLLDLERINAGKLPLEMVPLRMTPVIETAIRVVREAARLRGVEVRVRVQEDGVVNADERRIVQVLVNLLSNAIKFTPEGEQVEVVADTPATDRQRVRIIDKGRGFPPEFNSRIFGRFQQASTVEAGQKGSGLGLAICKAIISLHGGEIGAASEPGKGSTFWFELPRYKAHAPSYEAPA